MNLKDGKSPFSALKSSLTTLPGKQSHRTKYSPETQFVPKQTQKKRKRDNTHRSFVLDGSILHKQRRDEYDPLLDQNLNSFFDNPKMIKHLRQMRLINKLGFLLGPSNAQRVSSDFRSHTPNIELKGPSIAHRERLPILNPKFIKQRMKDPKHEKMRKIRGVYQRKKVRNHSPFFIHPQFDHKKQNIQKQQIEPISSSQLREKIMKIKNENLVERCINYSTLT